MSLAVCLLLLATASVINTQSVPQFEPLLSDNTITVGIEERPQQGDLVIATRARGLGGETVVYGVDLPSNEQGVFEIDSQTGRLTVGPNGPSRLVIVDNAPLTIVAEVFAYYNSSGSAQENRAYLFVNVEVTDINDPPDFGSATIDIPASELTAVGMVIRRITAVDHDLSLNGVVTYTMEQTSPSGQPTFTMNQFTGDLTLAQSLDIETSYQLRITATDFGDPALSSSVMATVQVTPLAPTFLQPVYTAEINEFTSQTAMTLVTVEARDSSSQSPGATIVYDIGTVVPTTTEVTFSVGRMDGVLSVSGTLDRETHSRFLVQVLAYESGHESSLLGAGTATAVISVLDVNEPPEFLSSHFSLEISEGAGVGDTLFSGLRAVDNDESSNAELTYSITSVTGLQTQDGMRVSLTADSYFLIDPQTAVISVNRLLEREAVVNGYHYYEIIVTVTDSGTVPLSDTTTLSVTVIDINDNPPVFANTFLSFEIPENSPTVSVVGEFTVSDRDQGTSAEMNFTLAGNFAERFSVRTASVMYSPSLESQPPVVTTAQILTTESLDREETESYQFTLTASDLSLAPLSAFIPVNINVGEVNDNTPLFASSNFSFAIPEDTDSNFIAQFTVTDADIGTNGQVDFSLSSEALGLFSLTVVEPLRVELSLSHPLDRDTRDSYNFRIFATDRGSQPRVGEADITVNVLDVNDNAPVFALPLHQASVVENTPPGLLLATVSASDIDIGENGEVYYMVFNSTLVEVNSTSGEVTLASPPDYEMGETVSIQILAIDRGDPAMTGSTMLVITVSDVNDNAPMFNGDQLNVTVLEGATAGSQFARIVATDADSGDFGRVTYSIVSESEEGLFQINADSGHLTVHRILDREVNVTSYTLVVQARDNGNPSLSSQVPVNVQVGDINDNAPVFTNLPYVTTVNEGFNESAGVLVFTVSAQDADIGTNGQIAYSLTGSFVQFFSIDPSTGVIRVAEIGVDFEALGGNPIIILTVIATDQGASPLVTTTTINITVLDGNDNAPEFVGVPYEASIPESNSTSRVVVVTVMARDADQGSAGIVRYQLAGGDSEYFEINTVNGEVYLPAGIYFDRETNAVPHNGNGDAVYRFGVAASDMGSPVRTMFTTVTLLVTDVNDNSPMFPTDTIRETISESLPMGTTVLTLAATDRDFGSNARVNYTILSEQTSAGTVTQDFTFSVSASTGVLSLAKTLDRETIPEITLVVVATDQGLGNNQDRVTVHFNVSDANDNRPIFDVPTGGYVASIPENATVGSEVITVMATDLDQGIHQSITYSILSNTTSNTVPFQFRDPTSGVVTVSGALDREMTSEYQLLVIASDSASNPGNIQQGFATVTVTVTDINDNTPLFGAVSYRGTVRENAPSATTVELAPIPTASDLDTTPFFFSLQGSSVELFSINQTNGIITTTAPLDYELQQLYSDLSLRVSDGVQSSTVPLEIAILDENDNSPLFDPDSVLIPLSEGTNIGTQVTVAMATDEDVGSSGMITYSLESDASQQLFSINPTSGVITLVRTLDYEMEQMHMLTVVATDSGTNPLNGTLDITIVVTDINDSPPVITNYTMAPSVSEDAPIGTVVGVVTAQDGDLGPDSGNLVYVIVSGDEGRFAIHNTTGVITVAGVLDREAQDQYELLIRVMDTTAFPLSDQVSLTVTIDDVNDNAPMFMAGDLIFRIAENTPPPAPVGSPIMASDADAGNNSLLLFSIDSQYPQPHFAINEMTGQLSVSGSLNREDIDRYNLNISVRDQGNQSLSAYRTVEIVILDENDNSPMFSNSSFSLQVFEGFYTESVILLVVQASDIDEQGNNSLVTYSIISVLANGAPLEAENVSFSIDPNFGEVSVLGEVNREMFSSYSLQLQAADNGPSPRMSQALLTISVIDVNDNPPIFDPVNNVISLPEGTDIGSIISVVRATDLDKGTNAEIEYRFTGTNLRPDLFGIQQDGSIFVNGEIDFETLQSPVLLLVEAVNSLADVQLASTVELTIKVLDINDNRPVFQSGFPTSYSIREDTSFGTVVSRFTASDADSGTNAVIVFRVVNNVPFRFDSANLIVNGPLDRETSPQYSVVVEAADTGSPSPLSTQITITIFMLDTNDNLPEFTDASPEFTIRENQIPGTYFGRVDTTDRDQQKVAFYFIVGGTHGNIIGIEPDSGNLFLRTNVDYDGGQTLLSAVIAAVSTNSNPGSSCNQFTCSIATLTVNVEDWNDNAPVLGEYDFAVNQSSLVNAMVGQISATDIDTGDFGRVNYEFSSPQSLFSMGAADGVIRMSEAFNASGDSKYNEVPISAYDNPDNRLPSTSFTTRSSARIYFVEERELVIVILANVRLADIQGNLDNSRTTLANPASELGIYIYDIEDYVTTLNLGTPSPDDGPQRREIVEVPKVNITVFGVNRTSQGVLLSDEFLSLLGETVESIMSSLATVEGIMAYPVPPPMDAGFPMEVLLLILYIVVGILGGLIIIIVIAVSIACCCLGCNKRRKSYMPGTGDRKAGKKSKERNSYPMKSDPYGKWSENVDLEKGEITYRERGIDVPSTNRVSEEFRESALYGSKEFKMSHFVEGSDNEEEVDVEIKPDSQSLSQHSAGGSTFDRQNDIRPLLGREDQTWEDDTLTASEARLELTADDDDEEETDSEEYTEDDEEEGEGEGDEEEEEGEGSTEEGSEEDDDEEEEGSEEEGSEEEEDDEDEYEDEEGVDFPEVKEWSDDEFPLMF